MKNAKIVLFASLLVAMILPFSAMNLADAAPNENANNIAHEKDKTKELKNYQKTLDEKVGKYKQHMEKFIELKESIDKSEKTNQSTNSLKIQLGKENSNWNKVAKEHKEKNTIPEAQLQKLMKQQAEFEANISNSYLIQYITGVGIDLHTKEIQVGLDVSTITADNKYLVIESISKLMPNNAKWHVVDSERASFDSCSSEKYCVPLLGGNTIKTALGTCSNGFKATLGGIFGFVTAGHCVDNKVGTDVDDYNNDKLGTVHKEKMYYGTDCDCGFVKASSSETDNKTLLSKYSSVTVGSYTSASSQSGDFIYKSGQSNSGLTYGVVTGINKSLWVFQFSGWYYITSLVQSSASSVGGDSGGTVMGGSQSNSLYGIISGHSGSNYYHVPTDKIVAKLGVAPIM